MLTEETRLDKRQVDYRVREGGGALQEDVDVLRWKGGETTREIDDEKCDRATQELCGWLGETL